MNRPMLWPVAVRMLFTPSRPHEDVTIQRTAIRSSSKPTSVKDGVSKEISFKEALVLAAQAKETLDGIERLRGVRLPMSQVTIQVDRHPGNRKRRVFRLYGPAQEVESFAVQAA